MGVAGPTYCLFAGSVSYFKTGRKCLATNCDEVFLTSNKCRV
jgi:hypothetical protein